jgi:hypothetical protein
MNRNSRILTWVFVAAVAYTAVAKLVYPRWIRPFFTYDERIVKEKERLEVLEEMEDRVKAARFAYRAYCERNGSVDPDTVRNELKTTLDALIERHGLKEATAVPPRRMVEDRKTGLQTMQFHLSAEGPLKDVVAFLKDIEELPQVARLRSPRIAPASSSSRNKDEDRFALRATLEAAVLPKMKVVGMLTDSQLRQPPAHVRRLRRCGSSRNPRRDRSSRSTTVGRTGRSSRSSWRCSRSSAKSSVERSCSATRARAMSGTSPSARTSTAENCFSCISAACWWVERMGYSSIPLESG